MTIHAIHSQRNGSHLNGTGAHHTGKEPHSNSRADGEWQKSYCPYCGVGCGLSVKCQDGQVAAVKGDPDHPSSLGDLCLKPIHLPAALYSDDRILYPQMRLSQQDALHRTSWHAAIGHIAGTFQEIIAKHGPDAIAFYGSGQFTTEDYYVANKLLKGFIGTNNFDANSRLCMASAVAGYATSLGSDGPPPAYADIEEADCFFLIGTNTAYCHPVLYNRIKRRKQADPDGVQVIVVDPRFTSTAKLADLYLPVKPGGDVALLNGILHLLIRDGWINEDFIRYHTEAFDAVAASVAAYTPIIAAEESGVAADQIELAAQMIGKANGFLSFWSMGLNQSSSGLQKNNALINLHLATGQIGKPGSGPFSLTGQPNAMGGREAGGLAHILPGYRSIKNPTHRAEIESAWGVPAGQIQAEPGLAVVDMFAAAAEGKIKAMWIMCTNPMVSMPNLDIIEAALTKLELLVVTDAYHPTDTSQFAHVLLPAAQWAERNGVMTNSERRITYVPQLVEPPGEALPDWQIVSRVARAMGYGDAFAHESSADIFAEFVQLTAGRLCDYSGVSQERLQREGPLQWPVPTADHPGTARLYAALHGNVDLTLSGAERAVAATDGALFQSAIGRAQFLVTTQHDPLEVTSEQFPLVLTTGRVKNQWHTMTRTGKSAALSKRDGEMFVELHPFDARGRNIEEGNMVEIRSARGVVWAKARITPNIRPGVCFAPFHWGRMAEYHAAVNNVTSSHVDPVSLEPELKACAVQIRLRPGYQLFTRSALARSLGLSQPSEKHEPAVVVQETVGQ